MSSPIEYTLEAIALAILGAQSDLAGVQLRHKEGDAKADKDRIVVTVEDKRTFASGIRPGDAPAAYQATMTVEAFLGTRSKAIIETWAEAINAAFLGTAPTAAITILNAASLAQLSIKDADSGTHESSGAEVRTWKKTYTLFFWY
jgi:hypothetical protein